MGNGRQWVRVLKNCALLTFGLLGAAAVVGVLADDLHAALPAAAEPAALCFPISIPGTPLIVQELAVYEGAFVEDGGDREIANAAALVVENSSRQMLEYAEVEIWQGQRCLCFKAECIPPGASVLMIERNGTAYDSAPCTACRGWVQGADDEQASGLALKTEGAYGLRVTNLGQSPQEDIIICYKTWRDGMYIGGIAYKVRIASLGPGESVFIEPYCFAAGCSRIVRVTGQLVSDTQRFSAAS